MEKQLESIISVCNEPGSRSRTLSAYDTAWVARVPSLSSLSSPAFPESLEWLRKNQTADGYWGDSFPLNSQANTLSTLAAILALNQWGAPQDMSRIQKGIEALKRMSPLLEKETYEVVAFELLLPSMVDEAKDHGWNLPFADYERYEEIGQKVRQKIALFREKFPPSTPATWWFSLEFFGSSYLSKDGPDLQEFEAAIAKNSSASASPSASAFLLAVSRFHGRDIPEVFEYLQTHTVEGGFPHIAPLDDFEVSFSLIYLLYAGIPPSSPFLAPLFEKLHNLWDKRGKTGLGYSSHFPIIDPDDTSHGIRALNIQGESIDLAKHIARFHSEDGRISTFVGERDSSFSVAINVMFLLKGEKESQEAQKMVKSIMNWLLTRVNMKGPPFQDKWHYSPYYPTSRAVLAFEGIHQGCFQLCVDWLLQTQRDDGGWGYFDISTTEETAYAAYSLSFASRLGHPIPNLALEKAQAFLKKAIEDEALVRPSLWIGKILYCPRVTVQALEIAALVSLKDSLRSNLPAPTQS